MLNLTLIGCGQHAERAHATALALYAARNPGSIRLAACCDLRPDRAEHVGKTYSFARAYDNWERMLEAERPEGVLCILPVPLIVEHSCRLLKRGVPTMIEKPLGQTREEARRLLAVAQETATPHMVSVNRRFVPRLNRAIAWGKERGPLQYVRCSMFRHRRTEDDFIWSTGIHALDAMRHIAGDVEGYRVQTRQGPPLSSRWHCVDLTFASGAVGRLDALTTAGSVAENYELFGEGWRVELSSRRPSEMTNALRCWEGAKLVLEDCSPDDESPNIARGEYHELHEFVTALREHRTPYPGVAQVLPSMELCLDLYEAGKSAAADAA